MRLFNYVLTILYLTHTISPYDLTTIEQLENIYRHTVIQEEHEESNKLDQIKTWIEIKSYSTNSPSLFADTTFIKTEELLKHPCSPELITEIAIAIDPDYESKKQKDDLHLTNLSFVQQYAVHRLMQKALEHIEPILIDSDNNFIEPQRFGLALLSRVTESQHHPNLKQLLKKLPIPGSLKSFKQLQSPKDLRFIKTARLIAKASMKDFEVPTGFNSPDYFESSQFDSFFESSNTPLDYNDETPRTVLDVNLCIIPHLTNLVTFAYHWTQQKNQLDRKKRRLT